MSPQEQLAKQVELLEQLASVDAEIKRLDVQLEGDRGQLSTLKDELTRLDAKHTVDRASADEMQKTINELVSEARQMNQQIDHSREKLGRARNERESMAAQRELEELRKLVRDREEEIGKLTALIEAAKRSLGETHESRGKVSNELSSNESSISSNIGQVAAEREQKIAARTRIAAKIPATTMRRYEAVRQKRGTALAKVTTGTCMACHMQIPPQLFQRLRRCEALEQCPSCQRILYWAAESTSEPSE